MQPPQSPNIWYLIGRGVGETTVRALDLTVGSALGVWEWCARVRRNFH